jgi:predicted ferric reductase
MKINFVNIRKVGRYAAFLAFLLVQWHHLLAQGDWKFRLEKNGIKVYTRHQPGSDFLWLKSTFETNVTLSQYAAIVLNVDSYKNWNFANTTRQ